MKKLYTILIILFVGVTAHAQPYETNPDFNRTRNWHFGHEIGLHFAPDTILFTGSNIDISETSAIHTDTNGNLLLYSNGQAIWNSDHKVIHNGNLSLGHYSSRQGSVFVFHPDNPDNVYLFNTNYSLTNKELTFNLIIKEADTFRVVFKDSVLQIGMSEPIAVVKADNGKDIWIVTHVFNGSSFIAYRLTQEGLIACPVISNSKSYVGGNFSGAQFAMSFSVDGKYLIKSNTNIPLPIIVKSVELYEFDLKTGKPAFLYTIDSMRLPVHGIVFSKSYNNIYIIERDNYINVFNFYPNDSFRTVHSKKQLQVQGYSELEMFKYEIQNLTYVNQLALTVLDSTHLAVLNDHEIADSVSITSKGISLEGKPASLGLPNFVKSYFHTPSINFTYDLNCISNTIQFQGKDTFSATSHDWFITKQGITMTANIKNPLIKFEDSGTYNVRYIASNGARSDTVSKEVVILPKIDKNFLGNDTGWCESVGASLTLQASSSMHCYEWSNGSTGSQVTIDTTGVYWAKIVTPNFCVLYDTLIVSVDTIESIATEDNFLGSDKSWCENIDTVVTLSAPAGFDGYAWSNGQTGRETEVSEAGTYWVRVSNRNQCEADGNLYAADTLEITLLPAPPKPILNRTGDSLFVSLSGDYAFRWYFNNALLADTLSYLIVRDTGTYFLEAANENCRSHSDTMLVAHLGIDEILARNLKVYPNPTSGVFVIEVLNNDIHTFTIQDIAGKVIRKGRLEACSNEIDLSSLSNGTYLITIYGNNQTATYKLIKHTE